MAARTLVGVVVSNKMDKTIVVDVPRQIRHPLYGKTLKRNTRVKAHDASNSCQMGDTVEVKETRPLSKTKNWELVKVIEKAN